jgi:hypothetical protein
MLRSFAPGSSTSLPSIFDRSGPRIPISVVFMHVPVDGSELAVPDGPLVRFDGSVDRCGANQ